MAKVTVVSKVIGRYEDCRVVAKCVFSDPADAKAYCTRKQYEADLDVGKMDAIESIMDDWKKNHPSPVTDFNSQIETDYMSYNQWITDKKTEEERLCKIVGIDNLWDRDVRYVSSLVEMDSDPYSDEVDSENHCDS